MNSEGLDRFTSVLVKIFGKHYLRKLRGKELQQQWNKVFVEYDKPINSEEELADYIREIGRPLIDRIGLPWRVFLVKHFKDTSVIIFKANHFLADGIGSILIASSLQDQGKPKPGQLPFIRQLSVKEKLVKYASLVNMPVTIVKQAIDLSIVNNDNI